MTQWQGWEESPVLLTLLGNAFDYGDANAQATATFSLLCPLCLSPDRWSRVVCCPPSASPIFSLLLCPVLHCPPGPSTAAQLGASTPCYQEG